MSDEFQSSNLGSRVARRTYLITHSQANLTKFPTRESFGNCVVSTFNSGEGKAKVNHWACCLENHENSGEHYHLCVKLSEPKRWKAIKDKICREHGIVLHFSEKRDNYYTAYKYVCKSDEDVFLCENHPNLEEIGSPATTKCINAYRLSRKRQINEEGASNTQNKPENSGKIRRLSNLEVSEFLINIRFLNKNRKNKSLWHLFLKTSFTRTRVLT